MKTVKLTMAGALAMLLVACESPYQGGYYNPQVDAYNRQMTGTLVGAAAGALIGNAVTRPTYGGFGGYGGGYRLPPVPYYGGFGGGQFPKGGWGSGYRLRVY
jgi:hypothetical protein